MATAGNLHVDKYLTGVSLAYPTGTFIARQVFPEVRVQKDADQVVLYGTDKFYTQDTEAEGVPAPMVDRSMGTPYSFKTTRHALADVVLDKEAERADAPIALREDTASDLTDRMMVADERRLATILTSESNVTQYTDIDAVADRRYDESSPTPKADWKTAKNAIYASTGLRANTCIIPYQVALNLVNTSDFTTDAKYVIGDRFLTGEAGGFGAANAGLPPLIWGLRPIVSDTLYTNAVKGAALNLTAIWGKHVIIAYIPPRPSLRQMAGGYTFVYKNRTVYRERQTDPAGEKILVEEDYHQKTLNLNCFYLLKSVIG